MNLDSALAGIGAVTILYIAYNVTRVLLSIFVLPGKSLSSFGPRGSWALITGASDGIGKEYAYQLAAKGFNLLLVSRTASKLEDVSTTITSKNASCRVETLPVDFATASDEDYANISKLLQGKEVAVLVNNVGLSHSIPITFADTPENEWRSIININCTATLKVTQIVLPGMLERKKGLVLTMGSFGGLLPTPLLATYSGSKAFLQQWSNALASEVGVSGVTVHFIQAYLITSAMSKVKKVSWLIPSEKTFVRSTLAKIGRRGGSIGYAYSGTPYPSHGLAAAVLIGILGAYGEIIASFNRKMHIDIRKRALRKAEREKVGNKKAL